MKTKVVTMCGSSRFCQLMAVCAWQIEKKENAITMGLHLLPGWYPEICKDHLAEHEGVADQMDELHLRKIDVSDEIFVVNYNDYFGESTNREIEYASKKNKIIRWYTHDPIGSEVDKMFQEVLKKIKTEKPVDQCKEPECEEIAEYAFCKKHMAAFVEDCRSEEWPL